MMAAVTKNPVCLWSLSHLHQRKVGHFKPGDSGIMPKYTLSSL